MTVFAADEGGQAAEDDVGEHGAAQHVAQQAADEQAGDRRRQKDRQDREGFRYADLHLAEREGGEDHGEHHVDRGDQSSLHQKQGFLA